MSTKPIFPEGVEVHQPDLALESTQRIAEDDTRMLNTTVANCGVASGLAVTVNGSTQYLIDIAAGSGYCPNGQYISNGSAILALSLADYTNLGLNYVCLVYDELSSAPRAHETLGRTFDTVETGTFRARVFSSAQFGALPATSSDFSVDAVDRCLIIALVTANGFSGSTPNNLTSASIQLASYFLAIGTEPIGISPFLSTLWAPGVEVVSAISADGQNLPALGTGTVRLVISGSPPTLSWQANGDAAGTPVAAATAGLYTLTSGAPSASTLTVYASPELYPRAAATYSQQYSVGRLLQPSSNQELSSIDRQLRRTKGGAAQTTSNIHGVRGSEIAQVLRVGQGMVLGDLQADNLAHALIPRLSGSRTNVGGQWTLWEEFTGGASNVVTRVYTVNSSGHASRVVTENARWDGTNFNKDQNGVQALVYYFGEDHFYIGRRLAANNAAWSTFDDNPLQSPDTDPSNVGAGVYSDSFFQSGRALANFATVKFYTQGDPGVNDRWGIEGAENITSGGVAKSYANMAADIPGREFVEGAYWTGTVWQRQGAVTGSAQRVILSPGPVTGTPGITIQTRDLSLTATWADNAWTDAVVLSTAPATSDSFFYDGVINFDSGSHTNPASNAAITNSALAINQCKAWCTLLLAGASPPSILDAFNITSVAFNGGSTGFTFTLAAPMASQFYVVDSTLSINGVGGPGGPFSYLISPDNLAAGNFDLLTYNNNGTAVAANTPGLATYVIMVSVHGRQ